MALLSPVVEVAPDRSAGIVAGGDDPGPGGGQQGPRVSVRNRCSDERCDVSETLLVPGEIPPPATC